MTTIFPFLSPNNLAEFLMYAGSDQELYFDVYTSASVAVNLSGASCDWKLASYGQTTTTVTKTAVIKTSPNNRIYVHLLPADTANLSGKFLQQYHIIDSSGSTFIPGQGIITMVGKLS